MAMKDHVVGKAVGVLDRTSVNPTSNNKALKTAMERAKSNGKTLSVEQKKAIRAENTMARKNAAKMNKSIERGNIIKKKQPMLYITLISIMKKKKTGKYMNKKFVIDFVWRYILTIIVVVFLIRILIYPERTMIKEYRKKLTNSHCVTKAYINAINPSNNTIYYEFLVKGIKYSGISRYSLLKPPYPEKGDSIEVYYSEDAPTINLWRGEFPEESGQ